MKKVIVFAIISLLFGLVVNAQTTKIALKKDIARIEKRETELKKKKKEDKTALRKLIGKEVNDRSKQQFMADFSGINDATWERTDHYDEASFMKDGKTMRTFYDYDSKLVGTTIKKSFSDLPANAQKSISEDYKSYAIGDILEYDYNGNVDSNMIFYNQKLEDADNYFVELSKDNKKIVLQVTMDGNVSYFTRLQ